MKRSLIVAIIILLFNSCNDALFDSGKTVTREIVFPQKVAGFEAESIFDITLVKDTIIKVLVTCGENLQPFVDIFWKNDTVHLRQHTKQNWSRKYEKIKLELHILDDFFMNIRTPISLITKEKLNISSFIVLDWGVFCEIDIDLNANYCILVNSPDHFGLIKAKGKSNYTYLWNRGSCKFLTDSLESMSCYVKHGGWGDVYVNSIQNLTISFENTGNVFYKGNPQIIIENQTGSGKVIRSNQ